MQLRRPTVSSKVLNTCNINVALVTVLINGCFIIETSSLPDRQPLKVSVNFLTKEKVQAMMHYETVDSVLIILQLQLRNAEIQAFFLSPAEHESIILHEE